jgi:putative phosphoesterase
MKIAVLSDIHGNHIALQTVLEDAKRQGVDHLFLLGDQLGYFYRAIEVFELIKNWSFDMISGNHERLFLEYLSASETRKKEINSKYGSCFSHYKTQFSETLINEIKQLPEEMTVTKDDMSFLLCHGSPIDKDQYIYPDASLETLKANDKENIDFVFNGHTHYPMIYKGKNSFLVNVGSVGQSRTVGGIANWGIINTKNGVYTPQNTPYNVEGVVNELKVFNEEKKYLRKVLKRNNKNYEN